MTEQAFTITLYDGTIGPDALVEARTLYEEIYAEPPYLEREADFAAFAEDLPRRAAQQSFRLVLARLGSTPLGFAMGHQLSVNTNWWSGAVTTISTDLVSEYPGRTFAVIELAVRTPCRQRGLGRRLHGLLIADLQEERTTLLVRPDARAANLAYTRWGYRWIGQIRPTSTAPVYDAMILT